MPKENPTQILRVAIYIRVSSERQAKEGDSLRDQLESLQAYVDEHENMVTHDVYVDDGVSGQKLERNDFTRLLDDVRQGSVNLIIFTKLDRWFRSLRHYLNTQSVLEQHHVGWIAIRQPYYETHTPHGQAFVNQSMMWAELEARQTSERINSIFENKVKYGEVLSGKTPLGYRIENKHLAPDENAPIVQSIFDYYAKTSSLFRTLRYLRDEYGIIMTIQNLRQSILTNTKYIGEFRGNPSYCEPLIDKGLFEQVQRLLSLNVKSNQKYSYIFSGLLVCSECGRKLGGAQINVYTRGYRYKYPAYECKHARLYKDCQNKGEIREKTIENYLLEHIEDEISSYIASYDARTLPARNNKAKKQKLLSKLDRLQDLYLEELLTLDEFKIKRMELRKQIEEIANDSYVEKDFSHLQNAFDSNFKYIYNGFSNEEKRMFWRSVIKEIQVSRSVNRHRDYVILFL